MLVSYLLGELNEEEQVRVEDRVFTDPSYPAEIEAAEADLVDTYSEANGLRIRYQASSAVSWGPKQAQ